MKTHSNYWHLKRHFYEIKSKLAADPHYFEKLIQTHFLDNSHRTILRLKPDPELGRRFEEDEKARLAKIRAVAE